MKKNKSLASTQSLSEIKSDRKILKNIQAGLKELQQFKKGTLKTTSAKDFLNEL